MNDLHAKVFGRKCTDSVIFVEMHPKIRLGDEWIERSGCGRAKRHNLMIESRWQAFTKMFLTFLLSLKFL